MYLLKRMKDEDTASVLGGADAVLVIEVGVPKHLELLLLTCFGLYGDSWAVFVKGGIFLIKRCRFPRLVLVGSVGEYKAGDFSGFRTFKADQETRL